MSLPSFALNSRTFVLFAASAALLFGALTFDSMSRREDPEIVIRTAKVETRWPGATARDVEELVTRLLEEEIYGIEEVKEIRSTSRAGQSVLSVDLEDDITDIDQVWDTMRAELATVQSSLPSGCGSPVVNSNFGDVSAVVLAVSQVPPPGRDRIERAYTHAELEDFAEQLEDALLAVDSIGAVTCIGSQKEQIYLEVDAADWAELGVTRDALAQTLDRRNTIASAGRIQDGRQALDLRTSGALEDLGAVLEVFLDGDAERAPVMIGDLPAELRRGFVEPQFYGVRFGTPDHQASAAIVLAITMKAGRNIVAMGEEIDAVVARVQSSQLPPDLAIQRVNDLPRQVDGLVSDFVDNLWQAVLIVLVVAGLLMGPRPSVVMAAAVPLSMVTALGFMPMFGVELEQFSIASLIIALGMIVDNAIVVSDNCVRLLNEGKSRRQAMIEGASNLAGPILVSTLTTVFAFLPLLTLSGSSGEYMRSLPIVVSLTLVLSWLVAMTVTPVFCFWFLKVEKKKPVPQPAKEVAPDAPAKKKDERAFYERLIETCLERKFIPIGLALVALYGAISLVPAIGSQFFPAGVRDQIFVHVDLPEGVSFEATREIVEQVEEVIVETSADADGRERLKNYVSFVGTGGPRLMLTMSPEDGRLGYAFVLINTDQATDSQEWIPQLRGALAGIPGARIDVRRFSLGPPLAQPVEYRLSGTDPQILRDAAEEMIARMRAVSGLRDPQQNWMNSAYELRLDVDQEAASLAGLSNAQIASSLDVLLGGSTLTTVRDGEDRIPLVLRLRPEQRASAFDLDAVFVEGASGKIPLSAVAATTAQWSPAIIKRINQQRTITVGARVEDGYLATQLSAEIQPQLQEIVDTLPPGYQLEERGEVYETAKSQSEFGGALGLSLLLILAVLTWQYNSLAKPLIVLMAVPLALIGALLGLYLSGWPLGFMPMLGIVSLAGVVINNSIILIDFIEEGVRGGMPLRQAITRAGMARMKPIVLTTLTTIGGLLPLALFGGPMWAGMAYAMMMGLAVSTALTLLVTPTVYALFAERFGMRVVANPNVA